MQTYRNARKASHDAPTAILAQLVVYLCPLALVLTVLSIFA